jgi:hypothetical protein
MGKHSVKEVFAPPTCHSETVKGFFLWFTDALSRMTIYPD